ncbi:ADP-ribosylglycohydrolase family protein [Glutamicibacter sp. ZJUTW]|uniref:ADP-ribosylglycohydrolase family protein n=1 Tax=Glutamicibacter sp. ZJUTW TaxID=1155384 RepID=UPI00143CD0B1|nr:ADP-ribosylglycohydrolase family protein [Glutamicibacter sp. ZJUTW]
MAYPVEVLDRILGVMTGMAAGDALGAGYEFNAPLPDSAQVDMIGGGLGNFAPGEWTDDTSMAIVVAQGLLGSNGKLDGAASDYMVREWARWAVNAPDVGNQTRAVLAFAQSTASADGRTEPNTADALAGSEQIHRRTGRSGGNGSLMRTAPVALAYLSGTPAAAFDAAAAISKLTHFDDEAAEACGLWTVAIQHAVLTGELDIRIGLELLKPDRAHVWEQRIGQAETQLPRDFGNNGWVVEAFQAAWSAITTADAVDGKARLVPVVEAAVRGGVDTDTVAAIAGSLIGAATGLESIPEQWVEMVHGWPGMRMQELIDISNDLAG